MGYIENNHMKRLLMIIFCGSEQKQWSPGGLQPPTFRLTAQRTNHLRNGVFHVLQFLSNLILWIKIFTNIGFQHIIVSSSQELTSNRPGEVDSDCLGQ